MGGRHDKNRGRSRSRSRSHERISNKKRSISSNESDRGRRESYRRRERDRSDSRKHNRSPRKSNHRSKRDKTGNINEEKSPKTTDMAFRSLSREKTRYEESTKDRKRSRASKESRSRSPGESSRHKKSHTNETGILVASNQTSKHKKLDGLEYEIKRTKSKETMTMQRRDELISEHDARSKELMEDKSESVMVEKEASKLKEAADFGLSGALAKDDKTGNVYKGIVLKWSEPEDARPPTRRWRFYVFKNDEITQTMHIHRQSAYLFGRERKIADIPVDHPSCSKQHAVLQYRLKETVNEAEMETVRAIKPYILDLESTNGTWLNNERIESGRYVELFEGDCLKFGNSTREYVLLHDKSRQDA